MNYGLDAFFFAHQRTFIKLGFGFFFLSTSESQNKTKGEDYPFFLTTICTSLYKLGHY